MDILKVCAAAVVVIILIQAGLFFPTTKIAEEPACIEKVEISYEVVYFPGADEKHYTITRENGEYHSDTGEDINPEQIQYLMASLTDLYEVEEFETSYDGHIIFDFYPYFEVTITSTPGKIVLGSHSSFHCFIPWNVDFYGRKFVQFNGKIPSALFKILVELDDYWKNHGIRDYDKIARWGCYSPIVPEYHVEEDFSPYFPHSGSAISPEARVGARHVKWKRDVGFYLGDPILADGSVFFTNSRTVTCIHSKTGKTLWNHTAKGRIPLSHGSHQYVQYRDGYLIVSTENGVTCLDADSGTVLWDIDTLPVADAPVYHAGSLLMGVERNTVVDLLCIVEKESRRADLNHQHADLQSAVLPD